MSGSFRIVLFSLAATALTTAATLRAQAQTAPVAPAARAGGPGGAPASPPATAVPGYNDVVATITLGNQTEKATKGEVITFVSRYSIPADEDRETVYRDTVDALVNTKILMLFLARQPLKVAPEKVDQAVEQLSLELKKDGDDLATTLLRTGVSLDDIRKEYENRLRWQEFVRNKASEATLRKYLADHRDLFNGTMVRASQIQINVDPNASDADKEKAKQKLASVKKEIEGGTITFAAAANKYSQDPANAGGAGGDLDYFTLSSGLIEQFTDVAFKLKKGMISDPVETPFGFHLIQVTDRKEGKPVDFEQNKPAILQAYATELQRTVVTAERKSAKIDVKPMPKDLFPAAPATPPASAPGGTEKAKTAGAAAPTPKQ
jgi:peptidyl-prolyl cis-trans isomerase C